MLPTPQWRRKRVLHKHTPLCKSGGEFTHYSMEGGMGAECLHRGVWGRLRLHLHKIEKKSPIF